VGGRHDYSAEMSRWEGDRYDDSARLKKPCISTRLPLLTNKSKQINKFY